MLSLTTYSILYFILKRNEKYAHTEKVELEAVNDTKPAVTGETTHM